MQEAKTEDHYHAKRKADRPLYLENRLTRAVVSLLILCLAATIGAILIFGRDIVIPIFTAFLVWHLLNAIARYISLISIGGFCLPKRVSLVVAIVAISGAVLMIGDIIATQLAEVSKDATAYQERLTVLTGKITGYFGMEKLPSLAQLQQNVDLASMITALTGGIGGIVSNTGIVALYLVFLFMEQSSFEHKLKALFPDPKQRQNMSEVFSEIELKIERYFGIKTFISFLTAISCYIVLHLFDVNSAEFWALLIFLFNYIPNIGSLFAVALPVIVTVFQYESFYISLTVLASLSAIQLAIGAALEPKMMGSSLNLSPLVIILSLTLWGSLWGVAGMFLCVPLMVIMVIILSHFEPTRPFAILLSAEGRIGR